MFGSINENVIAHVGYYNYDSTNLLIGSIQNKTLKVKMVIIFIK